MFENGSTYLKIDSHLHTQSDKEFSFDGPDNTFINVTNAVRERERERPYRL